MVENEREPWYISKETILPRRENIHGGNAMDQKEILKHVDHTLLAQTATWEDIKTICDDAIAYGTASVCIPPLMWNG